jgi:hypothetical protein
MLLLQSISASGRPLACWRNRLIAGLLWMSVAFAPWAFGSTQPWAITVLNAAGTLLGLLCLAGVLACRKTSATIPHQPFRHWTSIVLTWSTVLILVYSFVSALNAQSAFDSLNGAFRPLPHLKWLPHAYDRAASWLAFWQNAALAGTFWAARFWLLGGAPRVSEQELQAHTGLLPERARAFLMLIVTNGFLVALVALLQRLDNTDKLLWLVRPHINQSAESQFGPFAYRSNGLQYVALMWPLAMAMWSMYSDAQRQERILGTGRRGWVFLCGLTMAACPFFWQSRLALAANAVSILIVAFILLKWHRVTQRRLMVTGGILIAVGIALALNWHAMVGRFAKAGVQSEARRSLLQAGVDMFQDHWFFGAGPGAFPSLYPLYQREGHATWLAQMHCDWLQTLATYGVAGSALLAAAIVALIFSPRQRGKLPVRRSFVHLAWVGPAICLAGALLDFPFQVYAIEHLFVVVAALVSVLSATD